MTRAGGRDTSRIIEIRVFFDEELAERYSSFTKYLGPSLQFVKPFELLGIEERDQLIKVSDIDVRQMNPGNVADILKQLRHKIPREELLKLTYVKGSNLIPEKHLSAKVIPQQ